MIADRIVSVMVDTENCHYENLSEKNTVRKKPHLKQKRSLIESPGPRGNFFCVRGRPLGSPEVSSFFFGG